MTSASVRVCYNTHHPYLSAGYRAMFADGFGDSVDVVGDGFVTSVGRYKAEIHL